MTADTGFDYHCCIEVSGDGVAPNKESLAVMQRNLKGIEARDRVNLGAVSHKWFKSGDNWLFVMGANKK